MEQLRCARRNGPLAKLHMSLALAIAVALAVYAVVLSPLVWAAVSHSGRTVGWGYAAFLLCLAFWQTGMLNKSSLASTDVGRLTRSSGADAKCGEIMRFVSESGLAIDRSDPASPKIGGQAWEQIPPDGREMITECLRNQISADAVANSGTTPQEAGR